MTTREDKAAAARRRRREKGEQAEADARLRTPAEARRPTHRQLLLPLLDELQAAGGRAAPGEIYERLADRLAVPADVRAETKAFGGQPRSLWQRQVRWARQTAVLRGLVAGGHRGIWELTDAGSGVLKAARPGIVITIFETDAGAALWATAEAAAGVIEPGSVNLIYCSPPYPILTGREYGTFTVAAWLDWMRHLGSLWKDLLSDDGSLMVNLGPLFNQGAPVESTYQERFALTMTDDQGYLLAGKHYWYNKSRLPGPLPWVAVRRERVKPAVETIWWFSKQAHPKADNRRVLVPYSKRTLQRYIGKPGNAETRRGGYSFGADAWSRDNGGAIAPNLIVSPGVPSNDAYRKRCREAGILAHPAAFPDSLPDFGIRLTTEPGDLVYDPLCGSGTTAAVAARLGRRFLMSERSLEYLRGAALRFGPEDGLRLLLSDEQKEALP